MPGGEPGRYRWVVVGVATAANALAWAPRSSFALVYVAMLDAFAWGRGPTALGYSLSWVGFMVSGPVVGWLQDRWGARVVVALGGLVLGAGLALTGQVTTRPQYYLAFGLLGGAGIAGILIPSTTLVARWFVRARGTAMGVLSTGGSLATMAFYPLVAWLILALGWRGALVAFGGIVAAATAAVTLLYREPPAAAPDAPAAPATPGQAWTLPRALASPRLWAAFSMMVLGTIGFQIMATHQVAHAVDRGFRPATVVWVFAFGAGAMVIGNLAGGWLSDRVGRGGVFALGSLIAVAGIGCLAAVRGPGDVLLLVLYTASGVGLGMRIAQLAAIPADVFAGPSLGAILGVVQAGGGVGGAIGPFVGGWLFDLTGSYDLAFLTAALAIGGSAVAAWLAARPSR